MTMNWEEDVSPETRDVLANNDQMKPSEFSNGPYLVGTTFQGVDYCVFSDDLRRKAAACIEAADWLDKRAQQ